MPSDTIMAVKVTEREKAELVMLPAPDEPLLDGSIAGRTLASLVSPGTEVNFAFLAHDGFPRQVGYAAVMEVEAVGRAVEHIKPGDRVFCMGNHASHQRMPAERTVVVPEGLSSTDACFARLMGVSMTTLSTTAARPPEKVAVTGLGLVGHLAAQIFHAAGYRVVGCDVEQRRRDLLAAKDIAVVRDALPIGVTTGPVVSKQPEITPDLADIALVLECSGHEAATLGGCNVVRKGGEVVQIGAPWHRRTDFFAHDIVDRVFRRYVHLRSGWEWELPMHDSDFRHGSVWGNLAAAVAWLAEGRVNVEGLYDVRSPNDAQAVYEAARDQRLPALTTVFDWDAITAPAEAE